MNKINYFYNFVNTIFTNSTFNNVGNILIIIYNELVWSNKCNP